MRRIGFKEALVVLLVVATSLCWHGSGLARGISSRGGNWPQNWPKELEPFRERAESISYGMAVWTQYYIIEFRTREEFETVWPAVLKLKSKGAPIKLKTPGRPKTDSNDPRIVYDKPQLWIICPPQDEGKYVLSPDGTYKHIGPWTDDLESPDSALPERMVKRKRDGKWVLWKGSKFHAEYDGAARQARVELSLYVDGEIVDLNRIRIPENTPIKDNRVFARRKDEGGRMKGLEVPFAGRTV